MRALFLGPEVDSRLESCHTGVRGKRGSLVEPLPLALAVDSRPGRGVVRKISMSLREEETVYVAGRDIENAKERKGDHRYYGDVVRDTPQEAYDALGYFEREESGDEFEVFEFVTTTQVTKVDPPYTR
jgi:hypothetical protein